jgi:hypothetical protein
MNVRIKQTPLFADETTPLEPPNERAAVTVAASASTPGDSSYQYNGPCVLFRPSSAVLARNLRQVGLFGRIEAARPRLSDAASGF